jgi:hypothetical protein
VNVEKRDRVALTERTTLHVRERPTELGDPADRHVTRNERIGDARELAVMEVDVGAADLGEQHVEQRGTALDHRARELAHAHRLVRRRDRRGEYR